MAIFRVQPTDALQAPYNVEGDGMEWFESTGATHIYDSESNLVARILNASVSLVSGEEDPAA